MQTRFILGPAGTGKTFRCLAGIRAALAAAPDGPPLLLIAPKQTTYQLERQLLEDPAMPGYTRLHILSFERLANFLFDQLQKSPPRMLDEEGRLMVLRGLLAKKRDELKLFRASARLTGFAQHLSLVLRELQRHQLTPESLAQLAEDVNSIGEPQFQIAGPRHVAARLPELAPDAPVAGCRLPAGFCDEDVEGAFWRNARGWTRRFTFGELWVDGFSEFSPQELDLLAELLPHTPAATITFCLDRVPTEKISWLSTWAVVRRTYHQCRERLAKLAELRQLTTELLPRRLEPNRFTGNPVLQHLEAHWAAPQPLAESSEELVTKSLRVATCANPEAEVTLAAREILRFVRAGGRYREVTVLARNLDSYHAPLANIFARYEIPFYLDRRESVSHHPLAELSRNALRTVALSWASNDWFAALKTGLVPAG